MVRTLKTTWGRTILVDDEDYPLLSRYKWYQTETKLKTRIYTEIYTHIDNKTIHIGRMIMNPPEGLVVDHINGDRFDNRKGNLRVVTQSENKLNHHYPQSSPYPGVSWHRRVKKFQAYWKNKYLGYFNSEKEAYKAVKKHKESLE